MSLVKWNKRNPLSDLTTMMDDFFMDDFLPNPATNRFKFPAANIEDAEKEIRIELAAPGLEKKDFKVEVDNDLLVISAEKELSTEDEEKNYTRKEYNYNFFKRSFTLPAIVDSEKIKAVYENGILKLVVPKAKSAITKAKTIKVV